jgi:hypothetical protein
MISISLVTVAWACFVVGGGCLILAAWYWQEWWD